MFKPYKKIDERVKDFKVMLLKWIEEEKALAKKEKRKPRDPSIDCRDLEILLGYTAEGKQAWIPRQIKLLLKDQNIWFKKQHGYTIVKIIYSKKQVNKFGVSNAKGQRPEL